MMTKKNMCQDRNAVPDENVSEVKLAIVRINSINKKNLIDLLML